MQTKQNRIHQDPPDNPDPTLNYLFYLHGLIVEMAGIRPKSEEHGYYEYELILAELAQEGFVVISEVREKNTAIRPYAEKIAGQIKTLLDKGVPPGNITLLGASRGGAIGAYVSSILREKQINYVYLAGLFEKYLDDEELKLYGHVLSIHDSADTLGITPQLYFARSEGLGKFKAIMLNMEKGHGLLYKPYREWIDPILDWLGRE